MGGQGGEGTGQRLSSAEVNRTPDQYRRAAIWCTKTRVAAVERLLELAHPSRPTTKDVVLEERGDMLIEFQRLEEAIVEDMPKDLEGPTDDLVERMVEAAVAATLAGRDPGSKGGSEIRVAAARQAADLTRVKHAFKRHPTGRVEPWEFDLVDDRFPACKQEQCGLEELHADRKVRVKHLYAYIELAPQELANMQRALAGVAGIAQPLFDEEWAAAAAASRKRRAVQPPSGSDGEDSEGEEKKQPAAKARFGSLRTTTDEEMRRALDASLAVKDITRPPGEIAAPARPILPAGGALKGMDIRVSRPGGDYEKGGAEWRLDAKRGLVLESKAKHCRSFEEWDETFTVLMCKAPEEARDLLLQFRKWMRLMFLDYSWDHLRKFYDHLCARMEKEASTTFELVSYTTHREMYKRDKGIKAKGAEPEEVHVEDVTMASDGQEPEPAAIVRGAMARGLSGTGTTEEERARFQQEAVGVDAGEELLEELAVAVERYQDGAYAESTQRSYDTGVKAFLTFCVEGRGKRGALVPMAHAALVAGLKSLAVQGDWKSDCWERYCELDDEQRLILPAAFAEAAKELS
ncbi:hypothetical protein CYMTET_17165 [Cymbomonas tetramitiformis]|uniref:Uncharacterized protein n=1 Tax=Cymbomonas tetramitiformis TaxID=36881 RepID=A0AAE0GAG0_9CHLO|nr:hypothetical protein CYMTET_17165 [Cymbomonas tetramitiformis]